MFTQPERMELMSEFNGKVAIVTGAASGIGNETVLQLLQSGASVTGADLQIQQHAGAEFDANRFQSIACDVSERRSTEECVEATLARFGRLDILVNSAGISARNVSPDADFEARWDAVMRVNLKGSMLMSHAAAAAMRDNQPAGGSIVNLGSIMSSVVYRQEYGLSDGFNPYPHSKGGILQLTRDLAVQLAQHGIRANAVCPGFIDTSLTESLRERPELFDAIRRRHPLGRFGTAREVASVICFLASDRASFVTGAAWNVDGGYLAS